MESSKDLQIMLNEWQSHNPSLAEAVQASLTWLDWLNLDHRSFLGRGSHKALYKPGSNKPFFSNLTIHNILNYSVVFQSTKFMEALMKIRYSQE
jgi:hypothetical protein